MSVLILVGRATYAQGIFTILRGVYFAGLEYRRASMMSEMFKSVTRPHQTNFDGDPSALIVRG